jgi:hypothetical protein
MQKAEINAVHKQDLDRYLDSLGIKEQVASGTLLCTVCEERIYKTNIGAIYPFQNEIKVSCNKPACHLKVLEIVKEKP